MAKTQCSGEAAAAAAAAAAAVPDTRRECVVMSRKGQRLARKTQQVLAKRVRSKPVDACKLKQGAL